MIDEMLLVGLGVELEGGNDREIRGYCPVHHLVKGRPAGSAKWYMNRETGAWICFSCQQRGSLGYLVDLLGGDAEMLETIEVEVMHRRLAKSDDDIVVEKEAPKVYVSDYAFGKNPLPGKAMCELRDISQEACAHYNVRWSKEGKCFLIPLYTVDGSALIGWQEKSRGYFLNVPDEVEKSRCLFGFQQFVGEEMIFVESPLDVVRLATYGIYGAVATMGSYVSTDQIEAGVRAARRFVLAFDDDEAGDIAGETMAALFDKRQVTYRRFRYPRRNRLLGKAKYKDIGELPIDDVRAGLTKASSFTSSKLLR